VQTDVGVAIKSTVFEPGIDRVALDVGTDAGVALQFPSRIFDRDEAGLIRALVLQVLVRVKGCHRALP